MKTLDIISNRNEKTIYKTIKVSLAGQLFDVKELQANDDYAYFFNDKLIFIEEFEPAEWDILAINLYQFLHNGKMPTNKDYIPQRRVIADETFDFYKPL